MLSGLEPESISDYTEKSNHLLSNAKELDQYEVIEESPDVFVIYLTDDSGTKIARIEKKLPSKLKSENYINELVSYFEKLI